MLEKIYLYLIFILLFLLLFFIGKYFKLRQKYNFLNKKFLLDLSEEHKFIEMGKISAGIYHDVCNILTSSNLAWQQVEEGAGDILAVKKLSKQGLGINEKIINLLKNYRSCLKGEAEEFVIFDPNVEIQQVLLVLNFYFLNKGVSLKLSLGENCSWRGSRAMFFRVLLNLLTNALEAFPVEKENKEIKIKTFQLDNNFILEISDNAGGIAEEYLNKIFNKSFSLKSIKGSDSKNCGLGLFLVKEIVENHFQAEIEVESTFGQGTLFRVRGKIN